MGNALSTLTDAGRALYDGLASIFGANNIIVTSTKRDGSGKSQHNTGNAIDFKVTGMSADEAFRRIAQSGMKYNQLINEISGPASSGPHLHIGAGTGNENLIYKDGKYLPATDIDANNVTKIGWEEKLERAIWGDKIVDTLQGETIGQGLGRIIAIIIGVILIGLAIAAFVFKDKTAQMIVEKAIPA